MCNVSLKFLQEKWEWVFNLYTEQIWQVLKLEFFLADWYWIACLHFIQLKIFL